MSWRASVLPSDRTPPCATLQKGGLQTADNVAAWIDKQVNQSVQTTHENCELSERLVVSTIRRRGGWYMFRRAYRAAMHVAFATMLVALTLNEAKAAAVNIACSRLISGPVQKLGSGEKLFTPGPDFAVFLVDTFRFDKTTQKLEINPAATMLGFRPAVNYKWYGQSISGDYIYKFGQYTETQHFLIDFASHAYSMTTITVDESGAASKPKTQYVGSCFSEPLL